MKSGQIIESIKQYFSEKPEITMIIVYGSLAENRISPGSDVDIAIGCNSELSIEQLLNINTELQILLRRNIDLVDISKAEGLIHYKIMTKGIRLKGSDRELTNHMIKALDFRTDLMPQLMEMQRKRIERTAYGT